MDKVSILLVDDNADNLTALEAALAPLGERLVRAASGREALRHALEESFALILLDVQMPGLDGFETASLIRARERSRDTPILFVTAVSKSEQYVFRGYETGAVDYIIKPFSPGILRSKVRVFVNLHRTRADLERQLAISRQLNHALEESNEALEAFSFTVTHDLRAPLRAVRFYATALEEDYAARLDDQGHQCIRRLVGAAERMDALVKDLLDHSRLGRTELRLEPVPVAAVLADALAQVAQDLKDRGAHVDIQDPLPWVVAHAGLLAQVMANLIANAAKFVAPGTQPRVRLYAETEGEIARIWVADNGIGIAPEHHERIFGVFQRLHGEEAYPGTGIGLAIVRKAVERMGGSVGVESELGEGSRFWVELRAADMGSRS